MAPRVEPITEPEYRKRIAPMLALAPAASESTMNITRTWALNPALMVAQRPLQDYLRNQIKVSPRERELLILRTAVLCRADYVFAQHEKSGLQAGLSPEEIEQIAADPGSVAWSPAERLLLDVVGELLGQNTLRDDTWDALRATYDVGQILDIISLVGRYLTVSIMVNSLGVQKEQK